MASLTLSFPGGFNLLELLSLSARRDRKNRPAPETSPEATRSRREFVDQMLTRNPDAFTSDLDVQNMMLQFPGRF